MLKKSLERGNAVARMISLTAQREPRSELRFIFSMLCGRGKFFANFLVLHSARMWIQRMARPEWYARSENPGYTIPVESKHVSKVETIILYGGSASSPPSNHRTAPARRMVASSASGSVMFLRIHDTQQASFAFAF